LERLKARLGAYGKHCLDFDAEHRERASASGLQILFICEEIDRVDKEHAELRRRLDHLVGDGK